MLKFSELLRLIRKEANITQQEMGDILKVSKVLITMLENNQKEPSKKFIIKLAEKLKIHPMSLMPFLTPDNVDTNLDNLSFIEKQLINIGENLQNKLIIKRAKNLSKINA